MKNMIKFLLFIILLPVTLIHADSIDLLREKFQFEQASFSREKFQDREYVKNMLSSMYKVDHDHSFQEHVLTKLTDLHEKGETNRRNYAYLYDRVALSSEKFGMKQKY